MPVVVPIAGDDLEENGVFPVQIRRLVMEEDNQVALIGEVKQFRAFHPQGIISPLESPGGKLLPEPGKR